MIEIAIKVSDEQQTLRVKHLLYNADLKVDQEDPKLKELVEKAVADFKGNVQDVDVTIKFKW